MIGPKTYSSQLGMMSCQASYSDRRYGQEKGSLWDYPKCMSQGRRRSNKDDELSVKFLIPCGWRFDLIYFTPIFLKQLITHSQA